MPKSKRFQKVSLTNTKKKGLQSKQQLVKEIRSCVDEYARIFVLSVDDMRNSKIKDVRQRWKHSRFFFGKNKVEQLALGKAESDEYAGGLHQLSARLTGQCGLLFTNRDRGDVLNWFSAYTVPDYARAGNIAGETVTLPEGPLPDLSFSMEPQLRHLGLPTTLSKGVVTLSAQYTVCSKGDVLTPEQSRILKLFGHQLASFHVRLLCVWSKDGVGRGGGTFEDLLPPDHDAPH